MESSSSSDDDTTGTNQTSGRGASSKNHRRKSSRKRFIKLGNIAVSVIKGNISEQTTDVIVNTVVPDLNLSKGNASRALLEAAGKSVQSECRQKYPNGITTQDVAITGPGKLSCHNIYHVTLPKWQTQGDEKNIENIVQTCLLEANKQGLMSVSFPAFGTGFLKYPCTAVATVMFDTVGNFAKNNPSSLVKEVIFVIYTAANFTDFQTEARGRATNKSTTGQNSNPNPNSSAAQAVQSKSSLNTTVGNISINVSVGSIVDQKVDVIVNSCATDMNLVSRPGLGQAMVNAAGTKLQDEINQKFPNGIQVGDLVVTNGYDLHCKKVYHGSLSSFFAKKSGGLLPEQVLYNFVGKCLEEAKKFSVKSMAFPALGSGYLKFPAKTAAYNVIKSIKDFQAKNQQTSIRNIQIVIFGGSSDCTSIEEAYVSQLSSSGQQAQSATIAAIPQKGTRKYLAYKYTEEAKTPPYWTHFNNSKTVKEWNTSNKGSYCKTITVDKKTYQSISYAFDKTISGASVVSIERVENLLLFEQYTQECQRTFRKAYVTQAFEPLQNVCSSKKTACTMSYLHADMTKELYGEINEFYLFHGTKHKLVDVITQQGLDSRLASSGLLGTGVYTAEMADKSAAYTDRNPKGESKMFLMRVCLGDIYVTSQQQRYRRPPCKQCSSDSCSTHPDLFDSVVAEFPRREFVVYDRAKCYPEYLITYR